MLSDTNSKLKKAVSSDPQRNKKKTKTKKKTNYNTERKQLALYGY